MAEITLKQYTYRYPHPAVTADCVILTFHEGELKVLLIRRALEPYKGKWALPGGFMRIDESAEECALRELREETGVSGCRVKQFHTFSRPDRDPRERVVTVAFYALIKWQEANGADDAEFAGWIPMDSLPPLAFDHEEILKVAMEAIRKDIFFEPVGFELLDEVFSMPQLQSVYETILGKTFDRRNFAKKMKHLGILEETAVADEKKEEPAFLEEADEAPACFSNMAFCEESLIPFETTDPDSTAVSHKEVGCNAAPPVAGDNIFSIIDSVRPHGRSDSNRPVSSKSKGRNIFFRFNRKRYDKMKEDDSFEF